MAPEENVAFAFLVYLYNGHHDVRYNGRISCARVDAALLLHRKFGLLRLAAFEGAVHKILQPSTVLKVKGKIVLVLN
jgi:hypothetical protein